MNLMWLSAGCMVWSSRSSSGAPTVALGHRPSIASKAVVGMVDEVLWASMSSRHQTLAVTHQPYASSDPDSGACTNS